MHSNSESERVKQINRLYIFQSVYLPPAVFVKEKEKRNTPRKANNGKIEGTKIEPKV